MKIGILTPSIYMYQKRYKERIFAPGELVRHLTFGLSKRGHEVVWFSAPEENPHVRMVEGDRTLLEQDLQMRMFQDRSARDKISLYGSKMYYEMDLVTRAYEAARTEKLDVMHHFHSFGFLAHFLEELTGVPTLYTLHDPLPTSDMFEYWLFDRFPTHAFISISKSQQGSLAGRFFDTVYNGIDTEKFTFSAGGGADFVSIGRLVPEKGHDQAIVAVKQAKAKLTIGTWITDVIKDSLYYKTKIDPEIDGKDIQVSSLMQGDDLVKFYQHARALLFPIQWEEPFGLVMVEAMACGTPVIAYNRGSVPEIVKDGVTGFIVNATNPTNARNATNNFIIKKTGIEGLVEAIGRIGEIDRAACRRHVEENFTIDRMVDGYERVYKKVLGL